MTPHRIHYPKFFLMALCTIACLLLLSSGSVFTAHAAEMHETAFVPTCTTECYVDASTGDDSNSGTSTADALATIQAAVDQVDVGGTVHVAAGNYNENVTINKQLTLDGAGVDDTIIQPSSPGITITTGGTSAISRMVISNLTVTGATGGGNNGSGILILEGDATIQHITFENVASTNNGGHGIGINHTGTVGDILLTNVTLTDNSGSGFRIPSSITSFDGLEINGGEISNNLTSGLDVNPTGTATSITNIDIDGTTFANNATASINQSDLSFFSFEGDVSLSNINVTANGTYGIQFRGKNAGGAPNVTLDNVVISGSPSKVGLLIQLFDDVSNFSLTDVDLSGVTGAGWYPLAVDHVGAAPLDLSNMTLPVAGIPTTMSIWNIGDVDATGVTWVGAIDNFDIEDHVNHAIDLDPALGLVTWVPGNVYVTINSFIAPTTTTASIQRGVDVSSPGWTVNVGPGTYVEQVNDHVGVILLGADGAASTFIVAPSTIPASSSNDSVIVRFTSGGSSEISGFTITGPGPSGCGSILAGIFVRDDSTVYIHDNQILAIRDEPFSGCQNGVGILVGRSTIPTTGHATIENNLIEDFQKNGITVSGTGSTADVIDNTINGAGASGTIAQNGVQFSSGTSGTIDDNDIDGMYWTGGTWVATGILSFGDVTADGNTLTNTQVGIYQIDGTAAYTNNVITQTFYGGIGMWGAIGYGGDTDFMGNTVTGDDTAGTAGIGIYDDGGAPDIFVVTENTITDWDYGVDVGDYNGSFGSVNVNNNNITSNVSYGVFSNLFLTDATLNWWGDPSGPSGEGPGTGDAVSEDVLFCPWLTGPYPGGATVGYATTSTDLHTTKYCTIEEAMFASVGPNQVVYVYEGNFAPETMTRDYSDSPDLLVIGIGNRADTVVNGVLLTGSVFDGLTFENLTFTGDHPGGYSDYAVTIDGNGTYADLAFVNNVFDGQDRTDTGAIFGNRGWDGFTLEGNTFQNFGGSQAYSCGVSCITNYSLIFMEAQSAAVGNNYTVTGNTFDNVLHLNAVEAYRWQNVQINNNTVTGLHGRILVWSNGSVNLLNVNIYNNDLDVMDGSTGNYPTTGIGVYYTAGNVNIYDNEVDGANTCLTSIGIANLSVTGNDFTNCTTRGHYFGDAVVAPVTAVITGNTFDTADYGVENTAAVFELNVCDNIFLNITIERRFENPGPFTPCTGSITIIKDTQPDNGRNFTFEGTDPIGSFTLDDDGGNNATYTNSETFENLDAGEYTITETGNFGDAWSLGDIVCETTREGTQSVITLDLENESVEITLDELGDNVTCTFINQRTPRIRVRKYEDLNRNGNRNGNQGEDWLEGWTITLYDEGGQQVDQIVTDSEGRANFVNLEPGTYTVCETQQQFWVNSEPGTIDATYNEPCYEVTVDLGDIENLRFGNWHRTGSLTVTKEVDWFNADPIPGTEFEVCVSGGNLEAPVCDDLEDGESFTVPGLEPGDYTITEPSLGAEWTMTLSDTPTVVEDVDTEITVTNTHDDICEGLSPDPDADLRNGGTHLNWPYDNGDVYNTSRCFSYEVGIAAYLVIDGSIETQILHDAESMTVLPGQTVNLSVSLPDCTVQVDLFYGSVITDLSLERYTGRLLDFQWIQGNGWCDDPFAEDPPQNDPPQNDPPQNDPPQNDPPVNDPPVNDPPVNDPPQDDPPQEEPPVCTPNPDGDLKHGGSHLNPPFDNGTVTNLSDACTYEIGIASYMVMDGSVTTQQLLGSQTMSIGPGQTVNLGPVPLAGCTTQVDLFYGYVITDFSGGERYGNRLIDVRWVGSGYCGEPEPQSQQQAPAQNPPQDDPPQDDPPVEDPPTENPTGDQGENSQPDIESTAEPESE